MSAELPNSCRVYTLFVYGYFYKYFETFESFCTDGQQIYLLDNWYYHR